MTASRGITFSWKTSRYRLGRDDGIRVRFDASAACEMSKKVFAYRMLPVSPQTGSTAGTFSHVCSPADLAEYPEDEPAAGQSPQWFRLDYVDVLVRSREEADNFIEQVRIDIRRLKRTLDLMESLEPGGTEIVGVVCPVSSSSSSTPSSSATSESEGPLQSISAFGTTTQNLLGVHGEKWVSVGTGAGSNVGSSDSAAENYSRVHLRQNQTSAMLLVQGFDFSGLPDGATIVGLGVRVWFANVLAGSASSESVGTPPACPLPSALPGGPIYPVLRYLALSQPDLPPAQNLAEGEQLSDTQFTEVARGGDSILWGTGPWVASYVKQGEFGVGIVVGIVVGMSGSAEPAIVEVDGAEITVWYR